MPPPATFYTIGAFPYSQLVTQSDFNTGGHSGGVANEVWFKYVGSGALMLGTAVTPGTFIPRMDVFESDSLSPTLNANVQDKGFWTRLTTVTNYWIRVRKQPAGAATADFTFTSDSQTLSPTITPGDYVINDDENFPGIIVSPGGVIRGFNANVPGGEMLIGLPTGEVLAHDRFGVHGSKLALLDTDLSLISAFDLSPTLGTNFPYFAATDTLFYVMNQNRDVWTVDTSGTPTLIAPAVAATAGTIGISPDGTILYIADSTKTIKRYDLVGLAALSDLYTVTDAGTLTIGRTAFNGHPGEILVLSDGSIVTYYQNSTANTSVLLHISAAGALLHSYSYSTAVQSIDHIARAPNDPSHINIWWFLSDTTQGRYANFNIALGTSTVTFDSELFASGLNSASHTAVMFGPSSSCGFTTLLADAASTVTGSPEIPSANSSECCASPGVEGSGVTVPGAGVEHPVLLSPAWTGRCDGGGTVDLLPDLTDAEDWSDS